MSLLGCCAGVTEVRASCGDYLQVAGAAVPTRGAIPRLLAAGEWPKTHGAAATTGARRHSASAPAVTESASQPAPVSPPCRGPHCGSHIPSAVPPVAIPPSLRGDDLALRGENPMSSERPGVGVLDEWSPAPADGFPQLLQRPPRA